MRDLNVSYYNKVYRHFLKMKPKLKQDVNMLGFGVFLISKKFGGARLLH